MGIAGGAVRLGRKRRRKKVWRIPLVSMPWVLAAQLSSSCPGREAGDGTAERAQRENSYIFRPASLSSLPGAFIHWFSFRAVQRFEVCLPGMC